MSRSDRRVLDQVMAAVRRCRPLALGAFRSPSLRVERKADRSPVTAADRAVEIELRRALQRLCPGEPVVGEEFGSSGRVGSTYWTIDPIDGTRAFSRGLPTWSILVGRVQSGRPVLGLCDFPALDITIGVAPGVMAFERSGRRLRRFPPPRPIRRLSDAVVFHGGLRWWPSGPLKRGLERLIQACYLERAYGDCYGYLWALRGYVDAVIDCGVKVWDMVPLYALARATGRVMTDFHGRPCWTGPQTIMASPAVARLIAKTFRSA